MTGRSAVPDGKVAGVADQLAREIKRLRLAAGLSQRVLARRIGYSRQYVSMTEWVDGNLPSVELISAIDAALEADGQLVFLRRQAAFERRSQRHRPAGGVPPAEREAVSTKRRDMLRACGIGAVSSIGLQDLLINAARDSARLSGYLNRPSIDPATVDDAADDLRRVATEYVLTPDLHSVLVELISIRDNLAAQLSFAVRPADTRELYVLMSATCALLGSVSHDLAEPKAAIAQARSAAKFAELAGHRSLETWSHCTCAMIHSWWGTPRDVLDAVARATDPYGISAVRLSGLAARAYAELGEEDAAHTAIEQGWDGRAACADIDVLAEFGATFSFSLARQHYYNSMAYAELGEWSKVMDQAGATIRFYSSVPSRAWPATVTLAETNFARAVLHLEGPEAGLRELRSVLQIPEDQRIPQVLAGLDRVRDDLVRNRFGESEASEDIYESIREFESTGAGSG